jgi:hypothetical protein
MEFFIGVIIDFNQLHFIEYFILIKLRLWELDGDLVLSFQMLFEDIYASSKKYLFSPPVHLYCLS